MSIPKHLNLDEATASVGRDDHRGTENAMKLRMLAAAGVLVSAAIHLYLWFDVFRHTDVVGPAFMLNAVGGAIIAVLLVTWRHWIPLVLAVGFGAATLGAFIIAATVGLFGVHEHWTGWDGVDGRGVRRSWRSWRPGRSCLQENPLRSGNRLEHPHQATDPRSARALWRPNMLRTVLPPRRTLWWIVAATIMSGLVACVLTSPVNRHCVVGRGNRTDYCGDPTTGRAAAHGRAGSRRLGGCVQLERGDGVASRSRLRRTRDRQPRGGPDHGCRVRRRLPRLADRANRARRPLLRRLGHHQRCRRESKGEGIGLRRRRGARRRGDERLLSGADSVLSRKPEVSSSTSCPIPEHRPVPPISIYARTSSSRTSPTIFPPRGGPPMGIATGRLHGGIRHAVSARGVEDNPIVVLHQQR